MIGEEHLTKISQIISPIVLKASYGPTQAKVNWEITLIQHLGGPKFQPLTKNQSFSTPKAQYKSSSFILNKAIHVLPLKP